MSNSRIIAAVAREPRITSYIASFQSQLDTLARYVMTREHPTTGETVKSILVRLSGDFAYVSQVSQLAEQLADNRPDSEKEVKRAMT